MQRLLVALLSIGGLLLVYQFFAGGAGDRLVGRVTGVRTLEVEPEASVAFVNFTVENTTTHPFLVHDRGLDFVDQHGVTQYGRLVQGSDLKLLFDYFPELGGMKDEPFLAQAEIEGGAALRGLVAARFEAPKSELDARQDLILTIRDGANRVSEIREKP